MAVFIARSLCQTSRLPVSLTVPAILDQQDVAVASITASCSPSHPNFSVNVCLPRYTDRLTKAFRSLYHPVTLLCHSLISPCHSLHTFARVSRHFVILSYHLVTPPCHSATSDMVSFMDDKKTTGITFTNVMVQPFGSSNPSGKSD